AHMGGSDEMIQKGDGDQKKIWAVDKPHWSDLIRDLMNDHLNMYTDISYTLSALENEVVKKTINDWLDTIDSRGDPLGNRVMFGTDFFMTERVKKESVLYELAKREIAPDWYEKISRGNPDRYLSKKPPQ
ncbi:MAG: hypothetical protein IIA77_00435, partial [Proteobacteria bacterium]|nr:hypothetical protein [Pseudomonadota bacterium]